MTSFPSASPVAGLLFQPSVIHFWSAGHSTHDSAVFLLSDCIALVFRRFSFHRSLTIQTFVFTLFASSIYPFVVASFFGVRVSVITLQNLSLVTLGKFANWLFQRSSLRAVTADSSSTDGIWVALITAASSLQNAPVLRFSGSHALKGTRAQFKALTASQTNRQLLQS